MSSTDLKLPWPPELTVAAVIERAGRFLIVEEHADGRIVLNQPAGHVEPAETYITAVKRETLEETGWHFVPTAIIGVYVQTSAETQITYQRVCFTGQLAHQEPNWQLDQGIIQTHWLTRTELMQQQDKLRSPMVLRAIDDYLAQKTFPLDLITDLRQC